jgi:hypothetical protein
MLLTHGSWRPLARGVLEKECSQLPQTLHFPEGKDNRSKNSGMFDKKKFDSSLYSFLNIE